MLNGWDLAAIAVLVIPTAIVFVVEIISKQVPELSKALDTMESMQAAQHRFEIEKIEKLIEYRKSKRPQTERQDLHKMLAEISRSAPDKPNPKNF